MTKNIGDCEHDRDYTVACFFVKHGTHVNHDERMNPLSKLADMLAIVRGWTLLILEVKGKGHNWHILGVSRYRKNVLRYIAIFFHCIAIYCDMLFSLY